ncbi:olfactory receptor 2K2-like [Mixophyes fleayi]|uniref:olfactory receptor 2K2-like n=1 Tax=Mixophyes fleayi TaxID=3061075 RepID=UPI003F4DBBD3
MGDKAIPYTGVIYSPPGQEEELDRNLLQDINKVFTTEKEVKGPQLSCKYIPKNEIDTSTFTEEKVQTELSKLKVDKPMGPDGIHPRIAKELKWGAGMWENVNYNLDLENQTLFRELFLTGFSQGLQTRIVLFVMFLLIYLLTIIGNSLLICIIIISPQLHTPMYYFLCNLSFLDLLYSSSSLPKMLLDVFSKTRRISIVGCLAQMNTSLFLGGTECILLAVMAYDRYIAICFPLHYTIYMNWRTCKTITVIMWSGNLISSTIPNFKPLVFCRINILDHFVCEILALLELACGDVSYHKTALFVGSLFTLLAPFIFIVMSYVCIILSILKINSADGRSKAFSTCASHLIVVFMFYGTSMTMYMGQTNNFSFKLKYISLIYGVMTPVLNPLIYSLRNNEVKEAVQKVLKKDSKSHTL